MTQIKASPTLARTAQAPQTEIAAKAQEKQAVETGGEAQAKSTDGARQLDRFQRAGTLGRASQLKGVAQKDIGAAKDNVSAAADKMEKSVTDAVQDGQLRRSELLEMGANDAGHQAAQHDLGAAKALGKQADAMKDAAGDSKITASEQGKITEHRDSRLEHKDAATGLRKTETALRDAAASARSEELGADLEVLEQNRAANLPQIKQDYKNALSNYKTAVADAGGHEGLKTASIEVKDRVEGLRMQKDAAFGAVRASNHTGVLIRDAKQAMADGKVTTSEQAGLEKQVKNINSMYQESDNLKSLGQAVTQQANTNLAQKAIQSGNVKDLFTTPWGKELITQAIQQQIMMQLGYPMMSPGMDPRTMSGNQSGFNRSIFDMQQQMQLMPDPFMMMQNPAMQNNMEFMPGQNDMSRAYYA